MTVTEIGHRPEGAEIVRDFCGDRLVVLLDGQEVGYVYTVQMLGDSELVVDWNKLRPRALTQEAAE